MKTINLSQAKDKLSELVKEVSETYEPVVIAVRNHKDAALISMDEYDSLMETIEILQDHELMKKIKASMEEIKRGEVIPYEKIKKRS